MRWIEAVCIAWSCIVAAVLAGLATAAVISMVRDLAWRRRRKDSERHNNLKHKRL